MLFISCTGELRQKPKTPENIIAASLQAIGTKAVRDNINNIISLANCLSPKGRYTTEMHTARGGYAYFKQTYSYGPEPFEAVIKDKATGMQAGDPVKRLSRESIYSIRGHAFQNIVLEVDKRFHHFEEPERIDTGGVKAYRVKAKDELNNACLLFFDLETGLLSAIHIQNPADVNEIIKTSFSNWRKVQELQMPYHVEIRQGEKIFTFEFIKISFNSPGFQQRSMNNEQ
ncbi:MAG: hypothetical protein IPJ02_05445 [Chitinophagaceae bacterium]|nr:hypothetical protein [Chitinophagaceae bacterium]